MRTETHDLRPISENVRRRSEDVGRLVALVALLVTSPLFVAIAVAIKAEGILRPASRGPVLFTETRIGRGRRFGLLKFRTITRDALGALGPGPTHIKLLEQSGDLTRVGAWLKRWYLDELPQLINIVRGDMALVGTRPWPVELYEQHLEQGHTLKRDMPAGLLGPVQAAKGDEDSPSGLALDAEYFEAYKTLPLRKLLALDARITIGCLKVMAEHKGI